MTRDYTGVPRDSAGRRRRGPVCAAALALLLAAGAAPATGQSGGVPTREELAALFDRVIANQHRNDQALHVYERIERHLVHKSDPSEGQPEVKEDKTYRVVPTGTGTIKVPLREDGRPVDPAEYRRWLEGLARELELATNPQHPRQRPKVEKFEKRRKERAELVAQAREAFTARWLGREVRDGRTLARVELLPSPEFRPRSRQASAFQHVRVIVWIDEQAGQLVRAEADITRDISFGAGILGKVYRGGRFVMEQRPVAEGLWLPVLYQSDFRGRKFLFSFSNHARVEVREYRRIGPPAEALLAIRRELASGAAPRVADSAPQ